MAAQGMVDPRIFEQLQTKIDDDAEVRDQIRTITQTLERQSKNTQSILSRAHSTPAANLKPVLDAAENSIKQEVESISRLASVTSNSPYYKYNGLWTRDVQNAVFSILLCGWLGGLSTAEQGKLLTIEEIGGILNVPVNLKDRDAFHITIEEYLQSLITLIDELSRLAINSVTLGDYQRPLQISQFVKDVHAGFQILNLKNDLLRRRSDSIKYSVKKIEDIKVKLNTPKKADGVVATRILTSFIALLLTILSIPLLTLLQILFGAPLTTHLPHTLLSSAHIALLALFPLIYVHGSDGKKWREIASLYSPFDEVFGGAVGSFLGAWVGAVPIPLDWDREWQKWPVTIVTGVYAG
ncbi:putative recombination hotspot-binding protein (Translin) [Diplocarpon rosae]|nr:putative recombination hotspot-binding protein (Translin) [Diplocarpon rosae]